MIQKTSNQLPPGLDAFYKQNAGKIELILALIILVGLVLNYADIAGATILVGLSFGVIAVFYFLGGFLLPATNNSSLAMTIGFKVLHISWSVNVIGLMYTILLYPGASRMLSVGLLSMGIALLLVVSASFSDWQPRVTRAIMRSVFIGALVLVLTVM